MRQVTADRFAQLLATHPSPCISLYQPTHRQHPDNAQDTIRFRNLLGQLESSLLQQYDAANSHVDDMLDDLAELVMSKGSEVIIVPKERMPTHSGLAAIYRF